MPGSRAPCSLQVPEAGTPSILSTTFLLSQCLAALAFAAGIAAYQGRSRTRILTRWALAAAFNTAHFLLLGVPGVAMITFITCLRFLAAARTSDRRMMWIFMVVAVVGFLATYTRPLGFVALAATLLGTWASFQPKAITVRVTFAICATLWGIHNALAGSPVGALMEVAFLSSNAYGWWRSRTAELKLRSASPATVAPRE